MEKNMKNNAYEYVQLNHFVVQQKLTQHYKSTTRQLKKKYFRSSRRGAVVNESD